MAVDKGIWNTVKTVFLAVFVLAVPVLVGYDIYLQWHSPTMDFFLDSPGSSTVHSIIPDGKAESAGLMAGDVILTVDDVQFENWYAPKIGQTHILKVERRGDQISLSVSAVRLFQTNFISLASAVFVALIFWGIGTLLLVRRFWNNEIRQAFLLFQIIAISVLFPLSYMDPWSPPDWLYSTSIIGFGLISPMFFQYTITFPVKLGDTRKRLSVLMLIYGILLIVFWIWLLENRLGLQLIILFSSFIAALAIASMFYSYQFRASPEERRRSRIIIFGVMIAGFLPFLFYLLPRAINSPYSMPEWAAGMLLIIAPICYLYATLRYNLFGIDHLINKVMVYTILSFGIFIVYLGPYLFLYKYLPDDWFIHLVFIFGLTLWIGWSFDWLRNYIQRRVDKLFYGGWYDYPAVVELISDSLAQSSTREQIYDVLTNQVPNLMHIKNSILWIGNLNSTFPSTVRMKSRFFYKFQTDIPAQWSVDLHKDGDDLSKGDHRILHTLAQQADIALNNVFKMETLRFQLNENQASREALAQTQHQMLRSREEERSRLARDLHDSPIQSLIGLNIQLGLLLNENDLGDSVIESLREMRTEVRQLSSELREVCADLRPPMLDTLGLSAALRSLISEWADQSDVIIQSNLCPDASLCSLPGEVAVNYFRVAQEALVNISKHAKAEHVSISLIWEQEQLNMTIQDDGIGFSLPETLYELTANNHFGLAGMRERVNLIGGEWSLISEPGKGTIVNVIWRVEGVTK